MDVLLDKLNAISSAWKALFDAPQVNSRRAYVEPDDEKPSLPLIWTVRDGVLFLDDIWVCPAQFVDAAKLDGCARNVYPSTIYIALLDGSLEIIIIKEFGKYVIHAVERHV